MHKNVYCTGTCHMLINEASQWILYFRTRIRRNHSISLWKVSHWKLIAVFHRGITVAVIFCFYLHGIFFRFRKAKYSNKWNWNVSTRYRHNWNAIGVTFSGNKSRNIKSNEFQKLIKINNEIELLVAPHRYLNFDLAVLENLRKTMNFMWRPSFLLMLQFTSGPKEFANIYHWKTQNLGRKKYVFTMWTTLPLLFWATVNQLLSKIFWPKSLKLF